MIGSLFILVGIVMALSVLASVAEGGNGNEDA